MGPSIESGIYAENRMVGNERFTARTEVLDEPERTELFAKMVETMPVFSDYQSKTTRVIPVVALTRLE